MNLTKERIEALEQSLNEQRIQFELEGDREDFLRLIAYCKSQQPKVCRHCGMPSSDHVIYQLEERCIDETDDYPKFLTTTCEEAP